MYNWAGFDEPQRHRLMSSERFHLRGLCRLFAEWARLTTGLRLITGSVLKATGKATVVKSRTLRASAYGLLTGLLVSILGWVVLVAAFVWDDRRRMSDLSEEPAYVTVVWSKLTNAGTMSRSPLADCGARIHRLPDASPP